MKRTDGWTDGQTDRRTDSRTLVYHDTSRLKDGRIKQLSFRLILTFRSKYQNHANISDTNLFGTYLYLYHSINIIPPAPRKLTVISVAVNVVPMARNPLPSIGILTKTLV